jgi:hypothetical protein
MQEIYEFPAGEFLTREEYLRFHAAHILIHPCLLSNRFSVPVVMMETLIV